MLDLQGFGGQFALGALMTLKVAAGGLVLGLILGLIGAVLKLSKSRIAYAIGAGYTTVIRGLPELLVVLIIYFGSAGMLTRIASLFGYQDYVELSPLAAGIIALGIAFGAYATEVFRGAIQAIPKGQIEAAKACGMSRLQVFFRIVLPQAWRIAIPGLGNLFQVLLKDTSLISVVGLEEIMRKSQIAISNTKEPFTFYFAAAMIYLTITIIVMLAQRRAEQWASRGMRGRDQ
ncbi:MAG: ABC transporter permease [Gammaproteobacteria bacterium]|nr:ABC transporter permease [Gammaproteobacteria bacterium]